MPRYILMILVLIVGLGIGSIVPAVTSWWYDSNRAGSALKVIDADSASSNDETAKTVYHFEIEQGVLSVIEGTPGASGRVLVTGLDVQAWPKEMADIAPKVVFYSLDEVQSFIDTVNVA
ncbi:MAG: hypothetical protein APF81_21275 [Desulfosporosinus sp. BRH_c37]|nr:MAG: hypothetical protein APF81_21275 [Desulfosporosinus sp. BRH_c37]